MKFDRSEGLQEESTAEVKEDFGTPPSPEKHYEALADISVAEAKQYVQEGHFAPGSMLPKMQAAIRFAESKPGRKAIITSLYKAEEALAGKTGTVIAG